MELPVPSAGLQSREWEDGSSYSTPLISGLVAQLIQHYKVKIEKNMIISKLINTAVMPSNASILNAGNGHPNMELALKDGLTFYPWKLEYKQLKQETTMHFTIHNVTLPIQLAIENDTPHIAQFSKTVKTLTDAQNNIQCNQENQQDGNIGVTCTIKSIRKGGHPLIQSGRIKVTHGHDVYHVPFMAGEATNADFELFETPPFIEYDNDKRLEFKKDKVVADQTITSKTWGLIKFTSMSHLQYELYYMQRGDNGWRCIHISSLQLFRSVTIPSSVMSLLNEESRFKLVVSTAFDSDGTDPTEYYSGWLQ